MKRGGILLLALLTACGGAKDATPVADVKPAAGISPCTAAIGMRSTASQLRADGRLTRAKRTLAEASALCPGRAADDEAIRARIEDDLRLAPDDTGASLAAAAAKETDAAAARRLYARAGVAFERETGKKPIVAIENGLSGRTEFADMTWAGDGSLFFVAQGKTLIGLDPHGWRERFALAFEDDIQHLDAVPRSPTVLVTIDVSQGTTYLVDEAHGARAKHETDSNLRPVIAPDGTRAALVGRDRRTVTLVSLPDGAPISVLAADADIEPLRNYNDPVKWVQDGRLLAIEWADRFIGLYGADGKTVAKRAFAAGFGETKQPWRVTDDGRWLVVRALDAKRQHEEWRGTDLKTGADAAPFAAPACKEGELVAVSHASGRAAVWVRTREVSRLCVFDVAKGRILGHVDAPDLKRDKHGQLEDSPWTTGVAFSADDTTLVVRTASSLGGEHVRFARPDGSAWTKDTLPPSAASALLDAARDPPRTDTGEQTARRSKGPQDTPDHRSSVSRTKEGVLHARGPDGSFTSARPAEPVMALRFVERDDASRPAALVVAGQSGSTRRIDLDAGSIGVTLDGDNEGYRYPFALDARGMPVAFDSHYVPDASKVRLTTEWRLFTGRTPDGTIVTIPEGDAFHITQTHAALDAPGRELVAVQDDRVRVWDVAGARQLRSFTTQRAAVAMALSADGTRLATSTSVSPIQIWDVASGTRLCSAPEDDTRSDSFAALAFLGPRGDVVVTRSHHSVTSWRTDTCAMKDVWTADWNDSASPRRMGVSDDGTRVVVIGSRKLWVLDGALKPVRPVPADAYDDALAVANDGTIALGRENGSIDVFDRGGALRASLLVPRTKPGAAAAVAPDGRFRALGDEKLARAYLSCRFGTRVVALEVCADALEDPTLLSP
jgi:hypothetical protein